MSVFSRNILSSLGRKMLVAVAAALIVAGGSFAWFAYRTGSEMLTEYGEDKAYTLAQYGRGVVEFMMLNGEKGHLRAAMRTIDPTGHIAALFLLKPDGTVTVTPSPTAREQRCRRPTSGKPDFPGGMFSPVPERCSVSVCRHSRQAKTRLLHLPPGSESVLGYMAVKITMDRINRGLGETPHGQYPDDRSHLRPSARSLSGALFFTVIRPVSASGTRCATCKSVRTRWKRGRRCNSPPGAPEAGRRNIRAHHRIQTLVHRLNEAHAGLHDLHQQQPEHAMAGNDREMAASMAHEIRNPLAGVLGALQVIDADLPDDNPKKPIVGEMMVQMERMNLAVNDLLTYARPAPPKFDTTDLNGIIDRALSILNSQILKNNILVELALDRKLPALTADKKLLQQLLWNLILNALQAMDPGGRLSVSTVRTDTSVTVLVRDTGRGIPESDRMNVFKPFFTTKHQGTGLGLTISRRIVEQHGGSFALESVENAGTTCTIGLPISGNGGG